MSEAGMIFAQEGVSVQRAADYQKVMDSRWKFLDIQMEQEVVISHADSGSTHWWVEKLMDHNLGYLPAFTFRQISLNGPRSATIIATKRSIYARSLFVSGDPTTPIILKGYVRVFACDILKPYAAPVDFFVPTAAPSYPSVGIKMLVRPGGNIRSNEMSDFAIHTKAKALAIQQTGMSEATVANSGTLTITHGMGYPPTYFLARYETAADFKASTVFNNPLPNDDYLYAMDVASGAHVTANTTQVIVKGAQAALLGKFAYLITKEPAELAV